MTGQSRRVWVPEPARPDPTWARRGERRLDWVARSTIPRAAAARRFLNDNLAELPTQGQQLVYQGLRTRWPSAFFELVVGRTLQVLGADITVEEEQSDGKRIDFSARFPDAMVAVEAVSPA